MHIAQQHRLHTIVQVGFFRPGKRAPLVTGSGDVPIDSEVWDFFRDIHRVRSLGRRLGRRVVVIGDKFDPRSRERYRQTVAGEVHRLRAGKVVLLDPDTGIEPGDAAPEHVTVSDVQAVWEALRPRDWLVLYQHASRNAHWQALAKRKFATACSRATVEVFTAPEIASDVAFFGARRPSSYR